MKNVFLEILKLKSFAPVHKSLGNITTKLFGLGSVCYWVCLFLGWWLSLVFGLCVCGLVVRFGI